MNPVVSMTGAGAASGDTELGRTVVELRAVNGRGLAIKHRLPPAANGLEATIERAVAARIRRGTITCIVEVAAGDGSRTARVDRQAFATAVQELKAAAAEAGLEGQVRIADVLAVPGVLVQPSEAPRATREPSAAFADLVDRALAALARERLREGAATTAHLSSLLTAFARARDRVAVRLPLALADFRSKLLSRMNEFLAGQARAIEPGDVIREVAIYADRVDATEELQRITAHLARAQELLAQGGEVGRGLEFLLQELLREVNTLGSKAQDVEIAHEVVGMKANIDKLRELVANLE